MGILFRILTLPFKLIGLILNLVMSVFKVATLGAAMIGCLVPIIVIGAIVAVVILFIL